MKPKTLLLFPQGSRYLKDSAINFRIRPLPQPWLLCCSLAAGTLLLTNNCYTSNRVATQTTEAILMNIPASAWRTMHNKLICFGHQSVGQNIVEGISDLVKDHPQIPLRIVTSLQNRLPGSAAFYHFRVGRNTDPLSKIDDFFDCLESQPDGPPDIVMLKLCYIDFDAQTNVQGIFNHYKERVEYFQKHYPGTTVIHLTAPVVSVQSGIKAFVKRVLGDQPYGFEGNVHRERYNDLLRSNYHGKQPLFDVAAFESTRPDGTRETAKSQEAETVSLFRPYTFDGGHLSAKGSRWIAANLLEVLATASSFH